MFDNSHFVVRALAAAVVGVATTTIAFYLLRPAGPDLAAGVLAFAIAAVVMRKVVPRHPRRQT